MIRTFGTETTEGNIPHRMHPSGEFLCPVKLKLNEDGSWLKVNHDSIPTPERTQEGKLVYALPGGGRWVP